MDDDSTTSNVKDKAKEKADNVSGYASTHPRKMWAGAFLMGMGAGLLAAKTKKDDRSSLQKFIDHFGD